MVFIFTLCDNEMFMSFSFDYGEKFWIIKYKSFTCDCRSEKCKYSEETIAETIQNYNKRIQEDTNSLV